MQVQYLVGLCCVRRNPEAVDVIVGDMIVDVAAEMRRDVDVTVTVRGDDGTLTAFKAYEAKREGKPLDTVAVEQLCAKLADMPSLTERAIVSTSGYSKGAEKKAAAHGVKLYTLKPWTRPVSEQFPAFPNVGLPQEFLADFQSVLLYWINCKLQLVVPSGPSSFDLAPDAQLFGPGGGLHRDFPTWDKYTDALLRRSTEILFRLDPVEEVRRRFPVFVAEADNDYLSGPAWPHTHTVDVRQDEVFLKFDSRLAQIETITISGFLQWRRRRRTPEFYIMEDAASGEPFAGAAVADYGTATCGHVWERKTPPRYAGSARQ